MDELTLALRFGAALGLGVLLGLERERTKVAGRGFAGVRTIALIALAGGLAAFFEDVLALLWLALATFGAVAALVVVSYAVTARLGEVGITTEVTAVIAFLLGFLCLRGQIPLAAGLAVATALVLALKQWLHHLAQRIESTDVEATLQFAIVTLIILPLVPNENFGPAPLDVINPYKIWLMVVLISGINFASYILVKVVGPEHGVPATGLLGGLVSSTAVTLGFAQRSRAQPAQAPALALGILLAWTVMFARVGIMTAIVSRPLAARLGIVIGGLMLATLAICWVLWRRSSQAGVTAHVAAGENPFELRQAIQFGLLFGVVTFVAKAAQVYVGDAGLYLAGAVAGLTDVDAITLSMANLARTDAASLGPAAVTIVIAALSNTLVKAGIVAFTGDAALRRLILLAMTVLVPVAVLLLVLA
jgi:uncharacterized membrane protein (DUF4010 family)